MKRFLYLLFTICCCYGFSASAQTEPERLNLPGDNLNLYAVLKLFQESPTLETFEKKLNDSSSNVNNLDLDGDGKIDYIRVVDNPDGDLHNISLKIAINKTEEQNVAVFVVQKQADKKVQIQLVGDEDLYGKDYIIEPNMGDDVAAAGQTPNPGYSATSTLANGETVTVQTTTTYQIAEWPVIEYIYVPSYTGWSSPWYWGYYPTYWRPWRPFYWHNYYGYHFHWDYYYYSRYRHCNSYRFPGWRDRYYGGRYRSRSPYFENRFRQGAYRNTYSRPWLANRGAQRFKQNYPQAPSAQYQLPSFDQSGTPIRTAPGTRPIKPSAGIRPIRTDKNTRPVKEGTIRPDKQGTVRPTKEGTIRPDKQGTIRPTNPGTIKPVKEGTVRPTKQEPIRPIKQQPDRPTRQEPIKPIQQSPVKQAPIRQEPVRPPVRQEPVRQEPVRPVRQQPVRQVQSEPSRPVRQEPVRQVQQENTRPTRVVRDKKGGN
ncbi:MAG TPA: hypothetical protein PLC48_01490 [Ferruginibacter sp.]|nr:hypothetical protein [Ferruginibacter sp.]